MRDRRPRVLLRGLSFGRVLAMLAVHLIEPLRPGVVGRQGVVVQRAGWRDPVGELDLAEVGWPQPVEGGTVHLRRAAYEVVHLRLERIAVGVVPGVGGYGPAVDEDGVRVPVRELARQEVAALEEQDLLSRPREGVGERSAAGTAAHDDDVVPIGHGVNMPAGRELRVTPRGWCQGAGCRECRWAAGAMPATSPRS